MKIRIVKWLTLRYRTNKQTARAKYPFYLPDCQKWRMEML